MWEYRKIALNETLRRGDDIDALCDAGEEGWELVAVLPNGIAYLKREAFLDAAERVEHPTKKVEDGANPDTASATLNAGSVSHVRPKYRNPVTGETWSGRGRMATWLKQKVDAGEAVEKYLV